MTTTRYWSYTKYNYGSIQRLLEDFPKYNKVTFKGVDTGRREAIDALVYMMHRYYLNKGYVLTKEFVITADYAPKKLPKRYDYGIAYTMKFILNINGAPYQEVKDIQYKDNVLSIVTDDMTFSMPIDEKYLEQEYVTVKVKDDNREQTEGDMAVDEEEMSQSEMQGLPPLREEGHPRVSRVARL